jgi:ATP phosphoribosyltransferase
VEVLMDRTKRKIRIALPSKGFLSQGSKQLLADVGLSVYNPNPRQYIAVIPMLPEIEVIFQRPGDIVTSVRDGSVDFGITGRDVYLEKRDANGKILELHNQLGFGKCTLNVIVPDIWTEVNSLVDLAIYQRSLQRPLKIATKFPNLASNFFTSNIDFPFEIIHAEGALETAPTVGYADLIVDLVSTGTTLRDNRLKKLPGGRILGSEACLIANFQQLKENPKTLTMAIQLLELIGAYLRGRQNLAVFANVRADSLEEISNKIFQMKVISGLQGPTVSRVLTQDENNIYAIHVVVKKEALHEAIGELRKIGGSGVVVSPVNYIFEEEPQELSELMSAMGGEG